VDDREDARLLELADSLLHDLVADDVDELLVARTLAQLALLVGREEDGRGV